MIHRGFVDLYDVSQFAESRVCAPLRPTRMESRSPDSALVSLFRHSLSILADSDFVFILRQRQWTTLRHRRSESVVTFSHSKIWRDAAKISILRSLITSGLIVDTSVRKWLLGLLYSCWIWFRYTVVLCARSKSLFLLLNSWNHRY